MKNLTLYKNSPDYCHYYFDLVNGEDLVTELKKSKQLTEELFKKIKPENENFAYSVGKWTVKQVIKHIIDCERIYSYRALCFSRFDSTELPGFDQNIYAKNFPSDFQNISGLLEEFKTVRASTIELFKNMSDEMLDFKGTANQLVFTARGIGFLTIGHNLHHINFINQNYLNTFR